MNWHNRYRAMKRGMNWNNINVSEITGNTPDSIKNRTQPNQKFPRWAKLAIVVYESLPSFIRSDPSELAKILAKKQNQKDFNNQFKHKSKKSS